MVALPLTCLCISHPLWRERRWSLSWGRSLVPCSVSHRRWIRFSRHQLVAVDLVKSETAMLQAMDYSLVAGSEASSGRLLSKMSCASRRLILPPKYRLYQSTLKCWAEDRFCYFLIQLILCKTFSTPSISFTGLCSLYTKTRDFELNSCANVVKCLFPFLIKFQQQCR